MQMIEIDKIVAAIPGILVELRPKPRRDMANGCHGSERNAKFPCARIRLTPTPARRVGADPETDVAVIQVRADGLTELPFGDSDRLQVGDFVFAIGNPLPKRVALITANARSLPALTYSIGVL
jgi:trypsin-like peptidase